MPPEPSFTSTVSGSLRRRLRSIFSFIVFISSIAVKSRYFLKTNGLTILRNSSPRGSDPATGHAFMSAALSQGCPHDS